MFFYIISLGYAKHTRFHEFSMFNMYLITHDSYLSFTLAFLLLHRYTLRIDYKL